MSDATPAKRITSLDQFRGYSVAGMLVVNFLGGLAVTPHLLKHNNTHFSYADSIMPGFLFACGVAYRLTYLRALAGPEPKRAAGRVIRRSLALILVSLVIYGFNQDFSRWSQINPESVREFVAKLLKANLWEVLAIIGAVQLLILPVIGLRPSVRLGTLALFAALHTFLSWSFNYEFVYGRPNWMSEWWGVDRQRAWDGGFFGLISWAEVMLAGTLAYDVIASRTPLAGATRLLGWGAAVMVLGYGLSCLTTLYDLPTSSGKESKATATASEERASSPDPASWSPVLPPFERAQGRPLTELLANPPFIPPPGPDRRKPNYWMMDKRVVTQSFILFATGFSLSAYGVFVLLFDRGSAGIGLFRTFGQNALAAYIVLHLVENLVRQIVPKDSPIGWVLAGLAAAFATSYAIVRSLERSKLYLRL